MFTQLEQHFNNTLQRFMTSAPLHKLASGAVSKREYASFLKQIFYIVRENPQLQTMATTQFRGRQRDYVRSFFQHATSEVGHDQLALNDIEALGFNTHETPYRNPLPASVALTGFAYHQIYNLNPLAHLGYIFFLEFLPTQAGGVLTERLREAGVPDNAMTFISDHIEIDVGHNRLMEQYINALITNKADFDATCFAIDTTAYLYEQMISAAINDANEPVDTGWNWLELDADGVTPDDLRRKTAASAA